MKKYRLSVLVLILGLTLGVSLSYLYKSEPVIIQDAPPTDFLLTYLAECEGSNMEKAFNPADPVTPSFGSYQFKLATAEYYLKRYDMWEDWTDEELTDLLFTRFFAEELTRKILDEGHWTNWYNCLNKFYK